jgi:hypothetical protein
VYNLKTRLTEPRLQYFDSVNLQDIIYNGDSELLDFLTSRRQSFVGSFRVKLCPAAAQAVRNQWRVKSKTEGVTIPNTNSTTQITFPSNNLLRMDAAKSAVVAAGAMACGNMIVICDMP